MDQREIKTKRAIKNAFLILRAQKPIEKITIRELAALAEISKATFYLHYQDIYDLSEQIGKEVLTNILNSISRPENVLEKPDVFTREITTGFFSQINLIQLLFSRHGKVKTASYRIMKHHFIYFFFACKIVNCL